jgi:hypothetical protein
MGVAREVGFDRVAAEVKRAVDAGELFAAVDEDPSEPCDHSWRHEQCSCPRPVAKQRVRITVSAAIDWHVGLGQASVDVYAEADGRRGDAWIDIERAAEIRGVGVRQMQRLARPWRRLQVGKKKLVRLSDVRAC